MDNLKPMDNLSKAKADEAFAWLRVQRCELTASARPGYKPAQERLTRAWAEYEGALDRLARVESGRV